MPEVEVEVEKNYYSPTIHPSSTSTREPRPDVGGWQAGDVVILDTGEVCGRMLTNVVNPWALLNDVDDDGDQVFYEDADIEEHGPELLVRAGKPLVSAGLPGPVEQAGRPVEEIRADLATDEGRGSAQRQSPTGRLVADVAPLLASLAAAEGRAKQRDSIETEARATLKEFADRIKAERDEARARLAQLEALRALSSAATPGPWGWRHFGDDPANLLRVVVYPPAVAEWDVIADDIVNPATAEFIAAACNFVRAALAAAHPPEEPNR